MFNQAGLREELKKAIFAEKVAGSFYSYLGEHISNSYIRASFKQFAEDEAQRHKNLLQQRLHDLTGQTYESDLEKMEASVRRSTFSLLAAAKMAKDAESRAIAFYRQAKKNDKEYRALYKEIIRDEKRHRAYLQQDFLFAKEKIEFKDTLALKLFSFLQIS